MKDQVMQDQVQAEVEVQTPEALTIISQLTQRLRDGESVECELITLLLPLALKVAWKFVHQWPAKGDDILQFARGEVAILVNGAKEALHDNHIEKYIAKSVTLNILNYLKADYLVPIEQFHGWAKMAEGRDEDDGPSFKYEPLDSPELLSQEIKTRLREASLTVNTRLKDITEIVAGDDMDEAILGMRVAGYSIEELAKELGTYDMDVYRRLEKMKARWRLER